MVQNPQNPIQVNLHSNYQDGQVVQQQVQAGAHITLAFKVEQSKVQEFFGQKGKDMISVVDFI
jgi:hypothetical protein